MSNTTRQKILAKTSDLLERQGYHATGLNQIVKESGTPRGSIYYYFPDGKEELAAEAVTNSMQRLADHLRYKLNRVDDPIDAICGFIEELADEMEAERCCKGAPIAAVALETSNMSEVLRQACEVGYQNAENVFAAKLVMGGFLAEDAASLAATINAAMEGAMIVSRPKQNASTLKSLAVNLRILLTSVAKRS